jgi:flavodoxin
MVRALVLYHSLYGNTKTVAQSLAKGISESGVETICESIDAFSVERIREFDLIAIGSPTHILRPSKDMMLYLQKLESLDLKGKIGFSFDTRNESRMNRRSLSILENSAARTIESRMKRMKMTIMRSRESALVEGREGPLLANVETSFFIIGKQLGSRLITQLETV